MNLTTSAAPPRTTRLPAVVAALAAALLAAACSPAAATPTATSTAATASNSSSPTTPVASAATTTAPVATSSGAAPSAASSAGNSATLSCTAPAAATVAETEGPYYKAGAPQVTSLVTAGMTGQILTLTGIVVNTACQPLANAKVDIWQADASGVYDNTGYRLRGYLVTDAQGRFSVNTIIPGQYPGRTEHIHVKVTPAGGATLTTQLFFPAESASNAGDSIYNPSLLLAMTPSGTGFTGTFTFVLNA